MSGMAWDLYVPLLIAGLAWGLLSAGVAIAERTAGPAAAERVRDVRCGVALLTGAWVVVLVVVSLVDVPGQVGDMLVVMLVIAVFFAVLLLVLFALSVVAGVPGRARARRRRV